MSKKETPAAEEKSLLTTSKPEPEPISKLESPPPPPPTLIVPSKAYYHRHKPCANCLSKNADLGQNYRLKCRECGFVWEPDKLEYIEAATLKEAIVATVGDIFRKRYPDASAEEIAWRSATEIAWLREVCSYHESMTNAEKYVVNFNIFTRLKTTANV